MYRLCGKPKLTDPKWAREAFPDLERCRLRASESPSASRRGATGVCVPVCGRGEVCSPAAGGGLWGATSCRAQHMLALGDGQGLCTEKEAGCVLGQGGRLHPRCPPPVPIPGTRPWCPSPVPVPGARPRCPPPVPVPGAASSLWASERRMPTSPSCSRSPASCLTLSYFPPLGESVLCSFVKAGVKVSPGP